MASSIKTPGDSEIFECSKHFGVAFNSMFSLLKSRELCDVVLIAEVDKRVTAHRLVLAASSGYFRAMFTGSMQESREKEILLKEVEGEDLEKLVQFCYTGKIEIRENNVLSLLSSADLLQFDTVVNACDKFLDRHIHSSNCIGFSIFAEQHNLKTLQKNAEEYICKHFMEVCKTEEFVQLSSENLSKILAKDDIIVDTEEIIFNSLMSWIEYDKENREKYFHGFLSDSVRLRQLKSSFICKHVEPVCKTIESKQLVLDALKWHLLPEERVNNNGCNVRKTKGSLIAIFRNGTEINLHRYCAQTNKWTSVLNHTMPDACEFGVSIMKNKMFIVGGNDDQGATNTLYCVDIETMQCVNLSSMSQKRQWMGLAVLDGLLYAVGGCNESDMNTVERWDSKTNTWSCITPMLHYRYLPRVVALDGLLYAVGGSSNHFDWMNTIECYDPRTNEWTLKAQMNITPRYFGVAACGGYIYVVDGPTKSVERYNPATNTWSSACSRSNAMASVRCTSLGSCIIAVCTNGNVEEYDPSSDQWKSLGAIDNPVGAIYGLGTINV